MNKLYLDVSDVIHANEHTVCVNCGLHGSFWDFLLMSFCFMMKNNHVKQKLLLWSQVLLKIVIVITWFRTCWFECTWFVDFFASCSRRNNGSYNFSLIFYCRCTSIECKWNFPYTRGYIHSYNLRMKFSYRYTSNDSTPQQPKSIKLTCISDNTKS